MMEINCPICGYLCEAYDETGEPSAFVDGEQVECPECGKEFIIEVEDEIEP
jgi:endogenous inhibitor of DNA gyrase (YacG/DUF329 family)